MHRCHHSIAGGPNILVWSSELSHIICNIYSRDSSVVQVFKYQKGRRQAKGDRSTDKSGSAWSQRGDGRQHGEDLRGSGGSA